MILTTLRRWVMFIIWGILPIKLSASSAITEEPVKDSFRSVLRQSIPNTNESVSSKADKKSLCVVVNAQKKLEWTEDLLEEVVSSDQLIPHLNDIKDRLEKIQIESTEGTTSLYVMLKKEKLKYRVFRGLSKSLESIDLDKSCHYARQAVDTLVVKYWLTLSSPFKASLEIALRNNISVMKEELLILLRFQTKVVKLSRDYAKLLKVNKEIVQLESEKRQEEYYKKTESLTRGKNKKPKKEKY